MEEKSYLPNENSGYGRECVALIDLHVDVAHSGVDNPKDDDQQSDQSLHHGVCQMKRLVLVQVPQV